jgi:lysophospholipase L1-like esterase
MSSHNRRKFLKAAIVSGVASFSLLDIVKASMLEKGRKKIKLIEGNTILFQGDSITDAGRNKERMEPNNASALGTGYAFITSSELMYEHPDKNLHFYNKGISGNKVFQLAERWDVDCLEIKPDILSILIGVNDFWHMKKHGYEGTLEIYRNDLTALLERTMNALPNVQLIIGEPFAIPGISAVDESWFPDFDGYRKAAKDIAEKFKAHFIPYQSIFEEAAKKAPGSYWTPDGVHPSLAGSQLMAAAVLELFE